MIKNKKTNEKRGLKDWFRRLYGLEDENKKI